MAIKDHRMMLNRTLNATLIATSLSLVSSSAFAESITVWNPGFELDDAFGVVHDTSNLIPDPETYVTGWDYYRPASGNSGQYFNIYELNLYPNLDDNDVHLPGYTEDGGSGNVAFFSLGSDGCETGDDPNCQGNYPLGLYQDLTTVDDSDQQGDPTLQANSKYELTVKIGDPESGSNGFGDGNDYDYSGFGGYKIELVAGNEILEPTPQLSPTVVEGNMIETSLFYQTGSSPSALGAALGIRLIHTGQINAPDTIVGDEWYSGVIFDDVSLSVSAVPVPAAVWLFGTALLGLFGFGKRRKTVQPV